MSESVRRGLQRSKTLSKKATSWKISCVCMTKESDKAAAAEKIKDIEQTPARCWTRCGRDTQHPDAARQDTDQSTNVGPPGQGRVVVWKQNRNTSADSWSRRP